MKQELATVALLVRDYDEALRFYTEALHFCVVEDRTFEGGRRWVVIAPPGSEGCRILLAKAKNPEEVASIGHQAGGRVFLFLETDDFDRDHREMKLRGVTFNEEPRREAYGTVVVFQDLYGNKWDLIMRSKTAPN